MEGYNFHISYVGFEVLTAVVMKVAIFWDIAPCSLQMQRRFSGTCHVLVLYLVRLIFDPEDGGDTLLRNAGSYTDYTALYCRISKLAHKLF
jgi:hypothetical protein